MSLVSGFHYTGHQLRCDGATIAEIADRVGTPCYVYSAGLLRERYDAVRNAFARWDALVCFSVKSLNNLAVLRLLADCGSGFDVVSGGELYRVLKAGGEPSKTVYAGVGKTDQEIEYALRSDIHMFNVESPAELRSIDRVAAKIGAKAAVALRVNPDVDPKTHEKTTTGKKENKFGISIPATLALAAEARSMGGVQVRGVHMHLGSPVYTTQPYEQALVKMVELVARLRASGCTIDTMNMGGGYPISYTGEQVTAIEEYAAATRRFLEKLECKVIIEPGRYVSGPSGALVVRVLYCKESGHGKRFLICDGGMNDLIRPTLYGSFHRIWPAESPDAMPAVMTRDDQGYDGIETRTVDVVGPVCESGDFFAEARPLPPVTEGDLLVVFDAGAYGFAMSSNYNGRPHPAEVLVDAGQAKLVRRRETYGDLLAAELDLQQ